MEEIIEEEKKTVLVVDDEVTIVELLKHHLELEGYNVLEANSIEWKTKFNITRYHVTKIRWIISMQKNKKCI